MRAPTVAFALAVVVFAAQADARVSREVCLEKCPPRIEQFCTEFLRREDRSDAWKARKWRRCARVFMRNCRRGGVSCDLPLCSFCGPMPELPK